MKFPDLFAGIRKAQEIETGATKVQQLQAKVNYLTSENQKLWKLVDDHRTCPFCHRTRA